MGSVVATVDVAYEAEEEYVPHLPSFLSRCTLSDMCCVLYPTCVRYESKLPDGTRLSTKRTTTTQWTFRGVVSGQTELDWKITGFNGFGFE